MFSLSNGHVCVGLIIIFGGRCTEENFKLCMISEWYEQYEIYQGK